MKVTKVNIKPCSCNFCNRGVVDSTNIRMVYPYQTVYAFTKEKSGLLAHICDECLAELIEKTNALKNE